MYIEHENKQFASFIMFTQRFCVCVFTGRRQPLRDLLIKLNLIYLGLQRVCFFSLGVF